MEEPWHLRIKSLTFQNAKHRTVGIVRSFQLGAAFNDTTHFLADKRQNKDTDVLWEPQVFVQLCQAQFIWLISFKSNMYLLHGDRSVYNEEQLPNLPWFTQSPQEKKNTPSASAKETQAWRQSFHTYDLLQSLGKGSSHWPLLLRVSIQAFNFFVFPLSLHVRMAAWK